MEEEERRLTRTTSSPSPPTFNHRDHHPPPSVVECGGIGRRGGSAIIPFSAPSPSAVSCGEDEEDDEEYRGRPYRYASTSVPDVKIHRDGYPYAPVDPIRASRMTKMGMLVHELPLGEATRMMSASSVSRCCAAGVQGSVERVSGKEGEMSGNS